MHEVLIKVSANHADFRVELFDCVDGEPAGAALAQDEVPAAWLDAGIDTNGLTADDVITTYAAGNSLPNAKQIGSYLYQLIAPAEVGVTWDALRKTYKNGLATFLQLPDARWQSLPWELLYSPAAPSFIQQKARQPIFQYRKTDHTSCGFLPLRVLVIVGCDPDPNGQDADIKWGDELALLRHAATRFPLRLDMNVLKAPLTRQQIVTELAGYQPHVIHFIGHGIQQDDDNGALLLWSGAQNEPWHVHEINNDLDELEQPPRLAYINACRSAAAPDAGASVADCFLRLACGAVIAMRGDVRGDIAASFSGAFYRLLAEDALARPDKAFSGARAKARLMDGVNDSDIDWSLPRILFQCPPAKLFAADHACAIDQQYFASDAELGPVSVFVNRKDERRKLVNDVRAWLCDADDAKPVALLHGPPKVGKSWLTKSLLVAACLRGYRVFYWDFAEEPLGKESSGQLRYDAEDILHSLRRGVERESVFRGAWDDAAFAAFDALWAQDGGGARRGDENWLGETFEAFARGIATNTNTRPTLLVLDSFEKINAEHWSRYLARYIVNPSAQGDIDALRVFLVGSEQTPLNHPLPAVGVLYQSIGLFPADKLGDYVFDWILHYSDVDDPLWKSNADTVAQAFVVLQAKHSKAGWQPAKLDLLRALMEIDA